MVGLRHTGGSEVALSDGGGGEVDGLGMDKLEVDRGHFPRDENNLPCRLSRPARPINRPFLFLAQATIYCS